MSQTKLAIFDDRRCWRITWEFGPDEEMLTAGDIFLGEEPNASGSPPPEERDAYEQWRANNVSYTLGAQKDERAFYWDSKSEAAKALLIVNAALKQERPLPIWAVKATAEGWKPPKGWKA